MPRSLRLAVPMPRGGLLPTSRAAAMTGEADRAVVAIAGPELRRLAGSIVADQQREITQMRDWQAAHPNG